METSGKDCPAPVNGFDDLHLPPTMLENIKRCKFTKPTPVQRYSIPIGLSGRDLMACAQTGSGKTAAFCFPIIASMLISGYQPNAGRNTRKATPAALVLAPTRELTSQIYDEARKFTFQTGLRPVVIYGGAPAPNQVRRPPVCACRLLGALFGWRTQDCMHRRCMHRSQPRSSAAHMHLFPPPRPPAAARPGARVRHAGGHAWAPQRLH